jgi:hypothetical protein
MTMTEIDPNRLVQEYQQLLANEIASASVLKLQLSDATQTVNQLQQENDLLREQLTRVAQAGLPPVQQLDDTGDAPIVVDAPAFPEKGDGGPEA